MGAQELDRIVGALREEPDITRHATPEDVYNVVSTAMVTMAVRHEEGTLNLDDLAEELDQEARGDLQEYKVLWPLPGLRMPPGSTLDLAGLSIGPLVPAEQAGLAADAQQRGVPGFINRSLPSPWCWARATVLARASSLQDVVAEQVRIAEAVLRLFHGHPETVQFDTPATQQPFVLQYDIDAAGGYTISRFIGRGSPQPVPYEIAAPELLGLKAHPVFQEAQRVAGANTPDEMQTKILHALLTFRAAVLMDEPEERLKEYLTVIETLYGGEGEYQGRNARAARRLATLVAPEQRPDYRAEIDRLYAIRNQPVHLGRRRLYGRIVVTKTAANTARSYARQAILYALRRAAPFTTHEAFIAALDAEIGPEAEKPTSVSYATMVTLDPASGQYVATVPDFPSFSATGLTVDKASGAAESLVTRHIRDLERRGEEIPAPRTQARKAVVTLTKPSP